MPAPLLFGSFRKGIALLRKKIPRSVGERLICRGLPPLHNVAAVPGNDNAHRGAAPRAFAGNFEYVLDAVIDAETLDDVFQSRSAVLLTVQFNGDRLAYKNPVDFLRGHAFAVVGYGDDDALALFAGGKRDALFPLDVL